MNNNDNTASIGTPINLKKNDMTIKTSPRDFTCFRCNRFKLKLRNVPLQNLELIEISLRVNDLSLRGDKAAMTRHIRTNTNSIFGDVGFMNLKLEPKRGRQTSGALDGYIRSDNISFLIVEDFSLFQKGAQQSNFANWQRPWMRRKQALNTIGMEIDGIESELKLMETNGKRT